MQGEIARNKKILRKTLEFATLTMFGRAARLRNSSRQDNIRWHATLCASLWLRNLATMTRSRA
jgi:hypothetical protein